MAEQKQNQASQDLKNKLSKTLKKVQAPKVPEQEPQQAETPELENHEQAQMNPEQVQTFKESLHDNANYRLERLLQKENQHNETKQILIGIGLELNRIANALEKFTESGEPDNETQ